MDKKIGKHLKKWSKASLLLSALIVLEQHPAQAAARQPGPKIVAELKALQLADQRVADIAWRLLSGAGDLCNRRQAGIGISLHSLTQYNPAVRPEAELAFALTRNFPAVLSVAEGSPAKRAGILPNDLIIALNGRPFSELDASTRQTNRASYDQVDQAMAALEGLPPTQTVSFTLRRGGGEYIVSVQPQAICRSRVELAPGGAVEANANGTVAQVSAGMLDWTKNDDELALVIAHEVAHNLLGHQSKIDREKLKPGIFGAFGSRGRKLRDMEREADRLGTWLAAKAGFDYALAPEFFARATARTGIAGAIPTTHPSPANRRRNLQEVVLEISAERAKSSLTRQ